MSDRLIRRGRIWQLYSVSYNAGHNGFATKVRFGSRDRWVGEDYWQFVREYEPPVWRGLFL